MSNRKELQKILSREIEKVNIATLADRPTSGSRYGVGDLTAQSLKERFDAFPNLVKDRLNAIIDALASSDAGKYITIPEVIKGIDNIFDFIALFCEKESDEKNISDYIEALYTKVTETEPTSRTLQEIVDDMASRIVNVGEAQSGYDIVIRSDDEFSACLYPLYKDEENLTRAEAALMVTDDNAFNTPDPEFAAKRVLVKGVTFKTMRGYDDVRLHIFQPSIEYIKFEDCRWETHWKVSGKNPRDTSVSNCNLNTTPERATAFNRSTDPLTLTIEGLHITEDNVKAAPRYPSAPTTGWGIGLRNIKHLQNAYVDYPEDYVVEFSNGDFCFGFTCQFFDYADNCKLTAYWDGANIANCYVFDLVQRCNNITNMIVRNFPSIFGTKSVTRFVKCEYLLNIYGSALLYNCNYITNVPDGNLQICDHVSITEDEAKFYADAAERNATAVANSKVPKGTPAWGSYHDGLMLYGQAYDGSISFKHATTRSGGNEVAIRDAKGRLNNSWQDLPREYVASNGWDKGTCMPKHYIDALVKGGNFKKYSNGVLVGEETTYGYAPLNKSYKIDSTYLPSYVDDVIEGYLYVAEGKQHFSESNDPLITDARYTPETGKIYVDLNTNKTYRWSGSQYVEIAQSRIPTADEIGVYSKEDVDSMIGAITTIKKNDLVYRNAEGTAIDLLNKLVILKRLPSAYLSADCRSISKNERWTVVECNIRQEAFALILSDEKYSFPCRLTLQDEGTNRTYADAYLIFEYNAKTKKIAYINFEFPSYEDFQYMDIIEANLELYTFEKTVLLGG